MATIRQVINGSLRKLGVVGGQGQQATMHEFADSLVVLQSLYRSLVTSGAFGRMRDVVPNGDYIAGENQRIFRTGGDEQIIDIPDNVSACGNIGYCNDTEVQENCAVIPSTDYQMLPYGYHLGSGRRTIRDNSVISIVDENTNEIFEAIYDGQRKVWFTYHDLTVDYDEEDEWSVQHLNEALDSEAPLSHRDLNGLQCYLGMRLADEFGKEPTVMMVKEARRFATGISYNYSARDVPDGIVTTGKTRCEPKYTPKPEPVNPNMLTVDRAGDTLINIDMPGVDLTTTIFEFIVPDVGITIYPYVNPTAPDDKIIRFTPALAEQLGEAARDWVLRKVDAGIYTVIAQGRIKAVGLNVDNI